MVHDKTCSAHETQRGKSTRYVLQDMTVQKRQKKAPRAHKKRGGDARALSFSSIRDREREEPREK